MKIKSYIQLILIISTSLICKNGFTQISQGGTPYSFDKDIKTKSEVNITPTENVNIIEMPKIPQSEIDAIIQKNEEGPLYQFAYGFDFDIDLKQAATIDTIDIGFLYRLTIKSEGAHSINIIFNQYEVPVGAKLFMYNLENEHLIGAFTSNNNKVSKVLPVTPVKGDEITIEYFEPLFSNKEGDLQIGKINHDITNILSGDKGFGASGHCQVDINCPEGEDWQNEKRAVLLMLKNGTRYCTATLVNNTNHDGIPYALTAEHCICNQNDLDKSVFYFNYESPTCGGGDGFLDKSISGGTYIAASGITDFALIKLSEIPYSTCLPYYAGWDRNDIQVASGVGIHHPRGDVKKIATFTQTPSVGECLNNTLEHPYHPCQTTTWYNVNFWAISWIATESGHGIMEHVSSGSPLFNNQKHIIGQLLGPGWCEDLLCAAPGNQIANYGKFYKSWTGGGSSSSRLRDWLNPENDVYQLDGIAGCSEGTAVNLNITHTITSGEVEFYKATDNITASNVIESGATVTYEAGKKITLKPGFTAEAGSNFTAQIKEYDCIVTCDPINLVAWTSYVCKGDDLCFNILYATNYNVSIYTITGSLVYHSSGNISGNTACVWNTTNVAAGIYYAIISFDSDCDDEISNAYHLLIEDCTKSLQVTTGIEIDLIEDEPEHEISLTSKESLQKDFDFIVFPNPSKGSFTVKLLSSTITPYSFEIINSQGKVIYNISHINAKEISINQTGLPEGLYFIRLQQGLQVSTKKIIIQ